MQARVSPLDAARSWVRTRDPDYAALRRAGRAAILLPALFALGDRVIDNPTLSYFLAFGSFAMLLLVDFPGRIADRLRAQASLALACTILICLGTLAARSTPVAVASMAIVAFLVLFAGVISSVLAGATTSLLLAFILPVSLPAPASQIPDRVAGWGLASLVSLLAISLMWPAPERNPVRQMAIDACRQLAVRLRAEVAFVNSNGSAAAHDAYHAAVLDADAAVERLHSVLFATAYRPSGLASDARAVVRLVDELRWVNKIVLRGAPKHHPREPNRAVCAVKVAAADVMAEASELLQTPSASGHDLHAARQQMRSALVELEHATTTKLPTAQAAGVTLRESARAVVSGLDPSFRAQELSFVVGQIADNTEFAVAAERRSWLDRLVGRQPAEFANSFSSAPERAAAHARLSSSWLHNSLRGTIGLTLAVLVADVTSVQHGFWVVFGTLAVLRSNALSTGENVLRAIIGTTAGFIVGGALVYLIGTNTALLWALLPLVVLLAGLAPAMISFAAGQAAFTLTLLVLFNLLVPVGWKIGLVRMEDVAIGGAVSLAVGLLLWPRGAAAALGRALSEAYVQSAAYLASAVAYGVGRCDASGPRPEPPVDQARQAVASSSRLDDTFRGYLMERGAKPTPLAQVTSLVTSTAGARLAADALLDLWRGDGHTGDRSAVRQELLSAASNLTSWYRHFAASLTGAEPIPAPLMANQVADGRLVDAVARDLHDSDGHATTTGVKVIWTGDHLDAVRRLQETLVDPAQAAVSQHALQPEDELLSVLTLGRLPGRPPDRDRA